MKTPRRTGVKNTLFQNSPQSFERTWFRHQSGPPPCSAPNTIVPASFAFWLAGPLTFAEPVAVSASAKSTAPAKSQNLRRCIYSLRSVRDCYRQTLFLQPTSWREAGRILPQERHFSPGLWDVVTPSFVRGRPYPV